jgi:hypothetical protein
MRAAALAIQGKLSRQGEFEVLLLEALFVEIGGLDEDKFATFYNTLKQ